MSALGKRSSASSVFRNDNEAKRRRREVEKSDNHGSKSIILRLVSLGDDAGNALRLRVKATTPWSHVFKALASYKEKQAKDLKFVHDGGRIHHEEVGDIIDIADYSANEEVLVHVLAELKGS